MATSETFLVLTLMSFFLVPTGAETCKSSMCPTTRFPTFLFNPTIDFPFRLKSTAGQSDRCGYPGFELSCNNNQTVISMPSSGEFVVTSINYLEQTFRVNDPEKCMPRRYLADFTVDFPFLLDAFYGFRNFTFVNCTANETYPPYYMERFHCLSGPNYTVGALLGYGQFNSTFGCQVIRTVLVPSKSTLTSFDRDVSLSWNQPDCRSCRGSCGFKRRSGLEIACSDISGDHKNGSSGLSTRAKYGITIAAVLGFMLLSGLACHLSGNVTSPNEQEPNPNTLIARPLPVDVVTVGLSSSTIESYPKHVFSESEFELLTNSNGNNITCPICLCEYMATEEVRMIPECKHYFHVNCIDEWLQKNATCPLCRQSATSPPSLVARSSSPSSRMTQSPVEAHSH